MNRSAFLFYILLIFIINQACEVCRSDQPLLVVKFFDSTDSQVYPKFDRVYGVGAKTDLDFNRLGYLPINFGSDSTLFIFEKESERDTILVTHTRELDHVRGDYCIYLRGGNLQSSFDVICYALENSNNCSSAYETHIRY
ncbi:MAG: hypothetical protein ACPF8V_09120 [Luteibaculum sp.]